MCMMVHYLTYIAIMTIHILEKGRLSFTQLRCAELGFKSNLHIPVLSWYLYYYSWRFKSNDILQYAFPDFPSHDFSLPSTFFFICTKLDHILSFKLLDGNDFFNFHFLSVYYVNIFSVNVWACEYPQIYHITV